eukprot:763723-Hanusia_phi.AAC.1
MCYANKRLHTSRGYQTCLLCHFLYPPALFPVPLLRPPDPGPQAEPPCHPFAYQPAVPGYRGSVGLGVGATGVAGVHLVAPGDTE